MPKKISQDVFLLQHNFELLPLEVQELFDIAKKAADNAHSPYSNFQVGAALKMANGDVYTGSNQENASFPAGLCAERVAIYAAKAQHPDVPVEFMVIVAKHIEAKDFQYATPCGQCRQSMNEYEEKQETPIRIYLLAEDDQVFESRSVENLLPFKFTANILGANGAQN